MRLLLLPLAGMFLLGVVSPTFPQQPPLPPTLYWKYWNRPQTRSQPLDARPVITSVLLLVGRLHIPPNGNPQEVSDMAHTRFRDDEESNPGQIYTSSESDQHFFQPSTTDSSYPRPTSTEGGDAPSVFENKQSPKTTVSKSSVIFPDRRKPIFPHHQQHKPSQFDQGFITPSVIPSSTPHNNQAVRPESFEDVKKHTHFDQEQPVFAFREENFTTDNNTSPDNTLGSHPHRNASCYLRPDPGTCRAAFPRYFMDPETGTCNCFLYGGCRENGQDESPGSFFTLEECHRECHPPSMEEGPICKEIFDDEEQFVSFLA